MQLEWRGLESLDAKTLIIIAGIFLAVLVLLFIVKKIVALIITAAAIFAVAYIFPTYFGFKFSLLSIILVGLLLLILVLKLVFKRKK